MQFLPKDVPARLAECEERVREAICGEDTGIALVAMANTCGVTVGPTAKNIEELEEKCRAVAELILSRATDSHEGCAKINALDHQLEERWSGGEGSDA